MGKITKIKVKNFKSFGNSYQEFEFDKDMTLIYGANGHGKTTLLQAINYAFFGKVNGLKISELINNINLSNMEVRINYEEMNNEYEIVRGEKPKKLEIYKNGDLLDNTSSTRIDQDYIEKEIIKINQSAFNLLISLDSTLLTKSFITMSKRERKEFIEYILDIRILYNIEQISKSRLQYIKTILTDLEYKISNQKNLLESEIHHLEKVKIINEDITTNHHSKIEVLETTRKENEGKIEKYKLALSKMKEIKETIKVSKDELISTQESYTKILEELKKSKSVLDRKEEQYSSYKTCLGCDKLSEIIDDTEITEEDIHSLKSEILSKQPEMKTLKGRVGDLKGSIEKLESSVSGEYKFKLNVEHLIQSNSEIDKEIIKIKEYKILNEDSSKIDMINGHLEELEEELRKFNVDKRNLEYLLKVISDEGIKKQIFMKYIPIFNNYLNEYVTQFDLPYNIIFDDVFEVTILERGSERNFNSFSASERLRISLSVIFSFMRLIELRNSFNMNLLMLDELVDSSLSDDNVELLLTFIKDNISTEKEVMVISHRQLDKEMFKKIYKVKKENMFTVYNLGEEE